MVEDADAREPHCLVEQRDHTLIVTLNRPEARNALSVEMMDIMVGAWDRVDSDDSVSVAVLTGAGGYFCAGADLKRISKNAPGDKFDSGEFDPTHLPALLKGRRLTKPLIAAVEGPAIAGGTEILQGTDIRVAGESARFGVAEARWGVFPLGGSAVRLPRQIPYTVAADLLLTGRQMTAQEAHSCGLIGYVVPDGTALTKALTIADTIAANGPVAVRAILQTIRDTEGMNELDAFPVDTALGKKVYASDDAKVGSRAFARRENPSFTGK